MKTNIHFIDRTEQLLEKSLAKSYDKSVEQLKRAPVPEMSLNTHNILDYATGAALTAAPFAFGFSNIRPARNLFMGLGLGLIGYSLITRYKYSAAKVIPVEAHMKMDLATGAALVAAPFALGYAKRLNPMGHLAHWLFAAGAGLLVATTRGYGPKSIGAPVPKRRVRSTSRKSRAVPKNVIEHPAKKAVIDI